MKFKFIFIIFNIFLLFAFLFIFLAPLFILNPADFYYLLKENIYIAVIFFVFLLLFNIYFFANWKFYSYLEREDWGALISFLEDAIYKKGSLRKNYIKVLLNSAVVTSQIDKIRELEKYLFQKKPEFVEKYATQFSIPYLLGGKPEEAESFFAALLTRSNIRERDWIRWNFAFSLLQQNKIDQAKRELFLLLDTTKDIPVLFLTLYMIESYAARDITIKEKVETIRDDYRKKIPVEKWNQLCEKAKQNVEALILSQILDDAARWFFGDDTRETKTVTTAEPAR
ncbi:MAG: hypothetical protein JW904_09100 [Spirochaetales bacterium]|nr:hypothetical protein [Spirochaetales bacterium]